MVAQPDVLDPDCGDDLDESLHLSLEQVLGDVPLGRVSHVLKRRAVRQGVVQRHECREPGWRDEQTVDLTQRVIAGRPGTLPVGRERLVTLHDLLDHDPCPLGRGGKVS